MRHEVRRGRKFIEYHDDEQPEGTFTQEISGADVSYQDEAGSWRQLVEDWESDGADGFSFRASRMNHKVRFDSIGAWRWYPRRNVETEYLVLNRPQCWLTATKRWGNLLVNGISREGKDITLTSVRNVTRVIHSRWNGIKTDWILENANAPTRFRQKIDLVGITEIEGVLFGADGERLGELTPTTATDANGAELVCSGSYANGYVEFSADVTGAVYPVTIDPDFAGSTADAYIRSNLSNLTYADARNASGQTDSTAPSMLLGQYFDGTYYRVFRDAIYFDTSSIDDSQDISQVNLKLVCTADTSVTDFDIQIVKYYASLGNREAAYDGILAAAADDSIWRNTNGMSTNTVYTSGNLSTAWINKTGITGYSLRSKEDYDNSAPTTHEYVEISSANSSTEAYRPVLSVTYTEAASGTLLRVNMNAQMQSLSGGFHG